MTGTGDEPARNGVYPLWADRLEREGGAGERIEVRFVGRGPVARPAHEDVLAAIEPEPPEVAWAQQIHSAHVLEAEAGGCGGECGEGDALVTERAGLALAVVTADCVPVLLAAREPGGPIAAVHAGWRGIAAEIVAATLERLHVPGKGLDTGLVAWIGPAIGSCCYEVGEEVAEQVTQQVARAAGDASVVLPNPDPARPNPHLDLHGAVRSQLARAGVTEVRAIDRCTRCHPAELWSYRREGKRAGRNFGFLWVVRGDRSPR